MFKDIKKVLFLLSSREKKHFLGIAVIILLSAIIDMLGVASIFPFLSILTNPELLQSNEILRWLYVHLEISSDRNFFFFLGAVSFVILVVGNTFRALSTWATFSFSLNKFYALNKQLVSYYLYESYSFFLNRNSADLSNSLVIQVNAVIAGVITPWLITITRLVLILCILILLLITDPLLTVISSLVAGGIYVLLYRNFRKQLAFSGQEVVKSGKEMMKVANEAFGGIKEIKLMGKELKFIDQYCLPVRRLVNNDITLQILKQIPGFLSEIIAFGGLLLIVMYLIVTHESYLEVIPTIALYAFAARRLVPALQDIYQQFANIRSFHAALDDIYDDLVNSKNHQLQKSSDLPINSLAFSSQIKLDHITFQYKGAKESAIKDVNLTIEANTTVGIVGSTGAGKTTVIDIILGLLDPQEGKLVIDGVTIEQNNLRSWQSNIGYVPQHIYLSDDTVSNNIAFGVPKEEIDHQAVEQAARLANIHDFIVNDLPNGYGTEIGERGIRLSGGQQQRLGIAKALYRNPSLLVFDEATSALDGTTENIIMDAIYNLSHKKTIVIIAHRLTTVKNCDVIYMLERGEIKDQNTYQMLLDNNEAFRKMAKASS